MNKQPYIKQQCGIFLSSTNDPQVRKYRLAAKDVIEEEEFREKWYAVEMDTFTPSGSSSLDECRNLVMSCLIYIGILGPFYGSVNTEANLSYTEYEYTVARDADREIAIFLLPDDVISSSPPDIVKKQGPNMLRQDEFKERVNTRHMNRPVSSVEDFKSHLRRYIRTLNISGVDDPQLARTREDFPGVDTFDRRPVPKTYSIKDLNIRALDDFLKTPQALMALDRQDLLEASTEQHLQLLGLLHRNNIPSLGLFLCFAPPNLIADKFSSCSLHMVVYSDTTRGTSNTEYKEEAEDNLINLHRIGMKFFRTNAGLRRIGSVGTEDRDELEIPSIALREALANALVHRDYGHQHSKEQPTRIEVYSDRVEITSFGGLVPGVSENVLNFNPENIDSRRRNPIIAKIFMYMQIVEMGGSGVSRMHFAMQKMNLPLPKITQSKGEFSTVKVTFSRPPQRILPTTTEPISSISLPKEQVSTRVFVTYSRQDGTQHATNLRSKLEAANILVWQDINMVGGSDWWDQIRTAIENVEYLVLVATPQAMKSSLVSKEWRYARQQGVCVFPVQVPDSPIDFASLPRWMRDVHFFDLEKEWEIFVNYLRSPCNTIRVPFMAPDLPSSYVKRPELLSRLKDQLLDRQNLEPIAIETTLQGAGGFGKTSLAAAICHDEDIQTAFDDGILWVTLGESPEILEGITKLYRALTGENPGFFDVEDGATRLAERLSDKDCLIVIDDVWSPAHLQPFLQGGERCARLITSRLHDVSIDIRSQLISVDEMAESSAVELLLAGIEIRPIDLQSVGMLVQRLGYWPLMINLANGVLRRRLEGGQSLDSALKWLNRAIEKRGVTAFDTSSVKDRNRAIESSIEVSLELLDPDAQQRLEEVGIFIEDVDIPLSALQRLWGMTGKLDDFDVEELCERLANLSLLAQFDPESQFVRLHDVIHRYLKQKLHNRETQLHNTFLNTYGLGEWHNLPENEEYIWLNLFYHFLNAERLDELQSTAKSVDYLTKKIRLKGYETTGKDIRTAIELFPDDQQLAALSNTIEYLSKVIETKPDIEVRQELEKSLNSTNSND